MGEKRDFFFRKEKAGKTDEAVISDGSRQRAAAAGPHRSTRLGFHGLPWDNPEQKGARSNPRQMVT